MIIMEVICMIKNKKRLQGILIAMILCVLVCAAAFSGAEVAETPADSNVTAQNGKAGIVASLEQTESRMLDEAELADFAMEKTETAIVTVASKSEADAAQEKNDEKKTEEALTKTEKEWQDKVMADVSDFLCMLLLHLCYRICQIPVFVSIRF